MAAVTSLRVLHLAANRWWTGSADPIIRLLKELEGRGHRVLLGVIPGDRFEAKAREAGIPLVPDLSLEPRLLPMALLKDVLRLRRLVAREGVHVIHCHHSHDHWLGALCRGRAALVRTFHSLRAVKSGWPARSLHRHTHAVFAMSRPIQIRSLEAGFGPDRVWLLPGTADLGRFSPHLDGGTVRKELGLGDAPVAGSVARLASNRGHELLIEGFRLLLAELPEARLLLVGKGELRPHLERRVNELRLGARIRFTGYRDDDLPEVLAAMDCFVLMGAGSDESCRAALEAMAAGKPVVGRRVGALPETVVHGETGLLLPDDRPESVARALRGILLNPERARRMGAAGRLRAEREFNVERAVDTVEAVYRKVVGGHGPRAPGQGPGSSA